MEPTGLYIPISVLIVVAGWVATRWFKSRDDAKAQETAQTVKNTERLDKIEKQLLELDFPVKLLWAKATQNALETLHHPEEQFKEMDDLIDKLNQKGVNILPMTEEDMVRFKELLLERSTDMSEDVTHYEREQAKIMPTLMDNKVIEENKAEGDDPVNVELVGESKAPDAKDKRTGTQKHANESRKHMKE